MTPGLNADGEKVSGFLCRSGPQGASHKRILTPFPWYGALSAVLLAWGMQAIVTQSVLLREALVLMQGSELAWGVVLSSWLLGVAGGAGFSGRVAGRAGRTDGMLVLVLAGLSLAACLELWVFRGARAWLGVGPGELLPLSKTALAALAFIAPAGALVGSVFPLACSLVDREGGGARREAGPLGRVYALESAGSLLGGAAFSFWAVEHLWPVQTVLLCGAVSMGACAGLLLATRGKRWAGTGAAILPAAGAAILAVAALGTAVAAGDALNRQLVDRRWRNLAPGYEFVAQAESRHQHLAVGRRAGQFTLYCDGQVSADFPDPYTFAPLAHFWLCQHPSPRHVLVIGGGAEGLLTEILRHPVEHVDYVEPDPRLIELIAPFLSDVDRRALDDPRVAVHHVDARYYVKTQRDRFDLVIARLPEPTSALRARLYTREFYRELARAMTRQAVLCITAVATPTTLSPASGEYLASLRAALRQHFPLVTVGWGDPAQILAATAPGLVSTDAAELARRYEQRGVESPLFHPLWFAGGVDWLDPDKLRQRSAEIDAIAHVEISTDLRPVVYMQRLVLWEHATVRAAQAGGRWIERLRAVRWPGLVAGVFVLAIVTLLAYGRGKGMSARLASGSIALSIATTGFATMALSIIWLFAFQNLYGYVYQRIGWIIALFMGGLVVGCALAGRRAALTTEPKQHAAQLWRRLIAVDLLLAALSLAVPVLLPALGAMQSTPATLVLVEWSVSVMVALTGVLGGAAFALAGTLRLASAGRAAAAAGTIVGADHAGACAGALLTGILLVPVFGTAAAAALLVGMKTASALLLLLAGRRQEDFAAR